MTPQVNELISSIRARMEANLTGLGYDLSEAGYTIPTADNDTGEDVLDDFDGFIGAIADSLLAEFDLSEDDAIDYVFDVADEMAAAGTIPPLPSDDDPQTLAVWMGKAKSAGLAQEVMKAAEADAE